MPVKFFYWIEKRVKKTKLEKPKECFIYTGIKN